MINLKSVTAAVVTSVTTKVVLATLAYAVGELQTTSLWRRLTGQIEVGTFPYAEGPTSPTALPGKLANARFCALTRVKVRADLDGMCEVLQHNGAWSYIAGKPQQQLCTITCWDF